MAEIWGEAVVMAASVANFCEHDKPPTVDCSTPLSQQTAITHGYGAQMLKKSLNRLLAENLAREMTARGISANELGKMVGVSPRTIGNYLDVDPQVTPTTGKERSATLFGVEAVARKLRIHPLSLLTDHASTSAALSDDAAALGAMFDQLDETQRRAVAALVQSMQRPKPKPPGR